MTVFTNIGLWLSFNILVSNWNIRNSWDVITLTLLKFGELNIKAVSKNRSILNPIKSNVTIVK